MLRGEEVAIDMLSYLELFWPGCILHGKNLPYERFLEEKWDVYLNEINQNLNLNPCPAESNLNNTRFKVMPLSLLPLNKADFWVISLP